MGQLCRWQLSQGANIYIKYKDIYFYYGKMYFMDLFLLSQLNYRKTTINQMFLLCNLLIKNYCCIWLIQNSKISVFAAVYLVHNVHSWYLVHNVHSSIKQCTLSKNVLKHLSLNDIGYHFFKNMSFRNADYESQFSINKLKNM